jgi:plastocyanin
MAAWKISLFALLQLVPIAIAQNAVVQVGYQGLQFLPNTIYASPGSKIEFDFAQPDHDVAQGSYDSPCNPAGNSSFYSGALDVVRLSFKQIFIVT